MLYANKKWSYCFLEWNLFNTFTISTMHANGATDIKHLVVKLIFVCKEDYLRVCFKKIELAISIAVTATVNSSGCKWLRFGTNKCSQN